MAEVRDIWEESIDGYPLDVDQSHGEAPGDNGGGDGGDGGDGGAGGGDAESAPLCFYEGQSYPLGAAACIKTGSGYSVHKCLMRPSGPEWVDTEEPCEP